MLNPTYCIYRSDSINLWHWMDEHQHNLKVAEIIPILPFCHITLHGNSIILTISVYHKDALTHDERNNAHHEKHWQHQREN